MAMKTYKVQIRNMEEARQLNNIICSFPCDADLRQDRYVVDARSILGILSLNFGKPMLLDIYDGDNAMEQRLKGFCVEE